MKILIVEDRKDKRHNIKNVVQEVGGVEVEIAKTYFSAKNKIFLLAKNYDMIIMDMFLPDAKDDDELKGLAGKDLIFDMLDDDIVIPILVVTQYTEYTNCSVSEHNNFAEFEKVMENRYYGMTLPEEKKGIYDCTHYEGLHQYLSEEVPMYLGIVFYSNQFIEWKENILYFIKKVKERI